MKFQAVRWICSSAVQTVQRRALQRALGKRNGTVGGQNVGGRGDRLSDSNDRRRAGRQVGGVRKVYIALYGKQIVAARELKVRTAVQGALLQNDRNIAAVHIFLIARQF